MKTTLEKRPMIYFGRSIGGKLIRWSNDLYGSSEHERNDAFVLYKDYKKLERKYNKLKKEMQEDRKWSHRD